MFEFNPKISVNTNSYQLKRVKYSLISMYRSAIIYTKNHINHDDWHKNPSIPAVAGYFLQDVLEYPEDIDGTGQTHHKIWWMINVLTTFLVEPFPT